ncbi:hypothetical protein [Phytohabitans rumicis]|uniref:hypothetical protein n=1 Tax=Phytohabitans rumicis TaxID=1076125 RepID=UPI0015672561|nr:hypothetical protein [Phytohabitans rumicis]
MTTRTAKRPAVGRVRDALGVALLLTVGVTLWWWILPPDVLAGGGRTGPRQMLVTALLALPLALLAVGGAAWLARRRCWHNGGSWRVPAQAGATVGLLAVLLLATAPVQGAALDRWAPRRSSRTWRRSSTATRARPSTPRRSAATSKSRWARSTPTRSHRPTTR